MSEPLDTPDTPAAVIDTPAPVVETPADPDDAQAVEVQGTKMVPVPVVKALREELKSLKESANRAATLEQQLAQARPYQQFMEAHPELVRQTLQPPAPDPGTDPKLVELAQMMDYYKSDGKPDIDRAKKYDALLTERATAIANQMVQPLAQSTAQQQATSNWQQVVSQAKLPNGQPIDANILGEFWRHLPVSETAKPQVAAMVRDLAMMEQIRRSPLPAAPSAPSTPPIHTESIGRIQQPAQRMSATERRVASERGMTEEKYTKLTSDFQPGRMNPLED
jgi:hypothetical protein